MIKFDGRKLLTDSDNANNADWDKLDIAPTVAASPKYFIPHFSTKCIN